jgi:predicted Fe-Mo cluster-binding NifX family protein
MREGEETMSVIQLDIDDTLVHTIGMHAIQAFMERQLSLLRVRYLGEKITQAIEQAGFDHDKEVEEARQEAWQEYKTTYLPQR